MRPSVGAKTAAKRPSGASVLASDPARSWAMRFCSWGLDSCIVEQLSGRARRYAATTSTDGSPEMDGNNVSVSLDQLAHPRTSANQLYPKAPRTHI